MAPLLSIEGVSKEYHVRGKNVLALESIDLTVNEGEFVTIVGPSGCGKSTLLNLIVGLLRASWRVAAGETVAGFPAGFAVGAMGRRA